MRYYRKILPIVLAVCVTLAGCVSHTRYVTREPQTTLVDSVEVVAKHQRKMFPMTKWTWGVVDGLCNKNLFVCLLTFWAPIATIPLDLVIPLFRTTAEASVELQGHLVSEDRKPLSHFKINIPELGSDGMIQTDQQGGFYRSISLLQTQPKQWSGGVKIVTLEFDKLGNIDDGNPIQAWSPLSVELALDFDKKSKHLIVKRKDYIPKLLTSGGNPNDRDKLIGEWINGPEDTSEIVLKRETYASKKNEQIVAREVEAAKVEALRVEKANEAWRKEEFKIAQKRQRQVRSDLEKRYPRIKDVSDNAFTATLVEDYVNSFGQRIFEKAEIEGSVLYIYVTPNLAGPVMSANLHNFAEYAEMFYLQCGCDGEVQVGVDMNYLGQGIKTLLRFRVDPVTGRGRLVQD